MILLWTFVYYIYEQIFYLWRDIILIYLWTLLLYYGQGHIWAAAAFLSGAIPILTDSANTIM